MKDVFALVNEFDLTDGLSNALESATHQQTFCLLVKCLVEANAYNGLLDKSPFNFQPHGITDIHVDYCGMTIPGRPFTLDFEKNKFMEAYLQLLETLGRNNFSTNFIGTQMFKEGGYTAFGFELSPVAQDSSLFELVRQTNVSVRLNFKKLTPSGGLYCVVYAEFDQLFALDPLSNPIIEGVL
ncbi:unnamed protein product [Caenorhabditis brenneri]